MRPRVTRAQARPRRAPSRPAQRSPVPALRRTRYLVKWEGYDSADNTWEPAENVGDECISQFETEQALLRSKCTLVQQLDVPRLFFTCDDVTVWRRKGT